MHCTRTRWLHLCWMMLLWPLMVFAQSPDRILYNGKVLTVDQKFSTAQAIAIRGENDRARRVEKYQALARFMYDNHLGGTIAGAPGVTR